ncbi:hypothetical protein [Bacteroides caecimuris]|uniref:hypothetical protein n=1 Tax=Bacteroides caecimuris TaxID=1796613 RepID=UPI002570A662|nr:hypothetical protein [Bacteroides caecimuris]
MNSPLCHFHKHKLADILRSLYNVGIIGNAGKRVRLSFRGDDGLLLNQDMKIVDPLWKHLSISRRQSQE